jgi:hypothetical protein
VEMIAVGVVRDQVASWTSGRNVKPRYGYADSVHSISRKDMHGIG